MFHSRLLKLAFFPILALLLLSGCQARRVAKNETMVKRVYIYCKNSDVDKNDMYGYVKQKPNRRLYWLSWPKRHTLKEGVGYALYLHIYNMVSPKREKKRQERRDHRYDKRKVRRNNKNRKPPRKWKTIGEILYNIGEAPVILDSTQTDRTVKQLEQYLNNKGYFNSSVRDTVTYSRWQRLLHRKRKAIVHYIVEPAKPYKFRNIAWTITDEQVATYLPDLIADTLRYSIKRGENCDVDAIQAQRDQIVKHLRNSGYYNFTRDYVRFVLDTALKTHQVDVNIIIRRPRVQTNDSTITEIDHQRYAIRNVIVCTDYKRPKRNEPDVRYDTLRDENQITILYDSILKIKPEVIRERIAINTGGVYQDSLSELTYRQLTNLHVYRQVDISYQIVGTGLLDCRINLSPVARQSFIAQMEGTNTGGNLGIGGSYAYQNNNTFHGAERFEFRVKGGTEAQQPITGIDESNPQQQLAFNTLEAGADVTLNVPRAFFPFNKLPIKKAEDRRTIFQTSFNYQSRLDYDRSIGNLSYGYSFKTGKASRLSIFPLEINLVKVNPRAGLEDLLNTNQDPLLRYRFTDHFTNDFRVTYQLNTQNIQKGGNSNFLRVDVESAGNGTRGLFSLSNRPTDSLGSFLVGGIPFSQYVRFFIDYRYYRDLGEHQRIVIRIAHGIGWSLDNYPILPLEKSFYGGGANGIRAWDARSLGPGSWEYDHDATRYAQFGDIQAEYNIELRFKISKSLNGALFADGGNIWLLGEDPNRTNAEFRFDRFFNDLAFGPGAGLRYDLGFFIFRLDWAFRLRDPSYPFGERWWIGQRKLGSNLNFGIGYPF